MQWSNKWINTRVITNTNAAILVYPWENNNINKTLKMNQDRYFSSQNVLINCFSIKITLTQYIMYIYWFPNQQNINFLRHGNSTENSNLNLEL